VAKTSVPLVHRDTANPGQTRFNEETTDAIRRLSAVSTGRLLRAPQLLTDSGSYTPPADCNAIWVEVVGGGGGGGGAQWSSPNGSQGGGGAGGGYAAKYISSASGVHFNYACGAAGAGGSTSGGNGTSGGISSFAGGGASISVGGGGGGLGQTAAATVDIARGGIPGTTAGGDINYDGFPGHFGLRTDGTHGVAGAGGSSRFGSGGEETVANQTGNAGSGYGAGGGGGLTHSGAGAAGGAGTQGCILIWEFS